MAASANYTALLDACVLYHAPLRDLLLSLAHAGLFHARWTHEIQNEWVRNLRVNRPDLSPEKLERTQALINASVPDCIVEHYADMTAGITLPDPDDRHVLAAAIVGKADAIITFNLKDFPETILAPYNIEAMHPDDFIANQLELRELEALAAIKRMRSRLRYPPQTAAQLIATIERTQLPLTAAMLRTAEYLI